MMTEGVRQLKIVDSDFLQWQNTKNTSGINYGLIRYMTDDEFAECLMKYCQGNYKLNCDNGMWLKWNDKIWVEDKKKEIFETLIDMKKEIIEYCKLTDHLELMKSAKKLGNNTQSNNIINVAAKIKGSHKILYSELDSDKRLYNLFNGTLNLETLEFRKHCKEDLLTNINDIRYDLEGKCRRWYKFLRERFGNDKELIKFVQKFFGYILSGENNEQKIFLIVGPGATGKSMLINILRKLLGTSVVIIPEEYMLQGINSTPDMMERTRATLAGKRAGIVSEVNRGKHFNEALLKNITGEKYLSGRYINQNKFDFENFCRLIIVSNFMPNFDYIDKAFRRRIIVIPCDNVIAEENQDKNLEDKLEEELSGIMNWAIEGIKLYRKEKFRKLPEKVKIATSSYIDECDKLQEFIDEKCTMGEKFRVKGTAIMEQYNTWLRKNGPKMVSLSNKEFYQLLKDKNIEVKPGQGGAVACYGIGLINNEFDSDGSE